MRLVLWSTLPFATAALSLATIGLGLGAMNDFQSLMADSPVMKLLGMGSNDDSVNSKFEKHVNGIENKIQREAEGLAVLVKHETGVVKDTIQREAGAIKGNQQVIFKEMITNHAESVKNQEHIMAQISSSTQVLQNEHRNIVRSVIGSKLQLQENQKKIVQLMATQHSEITTKQNEALQTMSTQFGKLTDGQRTMLSTLNYQNYQMSANHKELLGTMAEYRGELQENHRSALNALQIVHEKVTSNQQKIMEEIVSSRQILTEHQRNILRVVNDNSRMILDGQLKLSKQISSTQLMIASSQMEVLSALQNTGQLLSSSQSKILETVLRGDFSLSKLINDTRQDIRMLATSLQSGVHQIMQKIEDSAMRTQWLKRWDSTTSKIIDVQTQMVSYLGDLQRITDFNSTLSFSTRVHIQDLVNKVVWDYRQGLQQGLRAIHAECMNHDEFQKDGLIRLFITSLVKRLGTDVGFLDFDSKLYAFFNYVQHIQGVGLSILKASTESALLWKYEHAKQEVTASLAQQNKVLAQEKPPWLNPLVNAITEDHFVTITNNRRQTLANGEEGIHLMSPTALVTNEWSLLVSGSVICIKSRRDNWMLGMGESIGKDQLDPQFVIPLVTTPDCPQWSTRFIDVKLRMFLLELMTTTGDRTGLCLTSPCSSSVAAVCLMECGTKQTDQWWQFDLIPQVKNFPVPRPYTDAVLACQQWGGRLLRSHRPYLSLQDSLTHRLIKPWVHDLAQPSRCCMYLNSERTTSCDTDYSRPQMMRPFICELGFEETDSQPTMQPTPYPTFRPTTRAPTSNSRLMSELDQWQGFVSLLGSCFVSEDCPSAYLWSKACTYRPISGGLWVEACVAACCTPL